MIHEQAWPDAERCDASLRRAVTEHRQLSPDARLEVMSPSGWSSAKDLTDWGDPAVDALTGFVHELIEELSGGEIESLVGWAILLPPGGHIRPHDHGDADLVAIYYLDPGSNAAALQFPEQSIELEPKRGLVVVFPGNRVHRVNGGAEFTQKPRISLAFNASLKA